MSSNGINPLARWLIGGSAVLVVVAVVYGIMTSGIHLPPATETASTQSEDSINPQQLFEAPVMIAAFESSDRHVREIPPHGGIDSI